MKNDVFDLSLTHFKLFKPVPNLRLTYKIPANNNIESALKQHWSSTFINVVSTLKFGWKWNLNRGMFIDVVSTLSKVKISYLEEWSEKYVCWPLVSILLSLMIYKSGS